MSLPDNEALLDSFNATALDSLAQLLDNLDDLTAGIHLYDLAEVLHYRALAHVRTARREGRTWDSIGAAFGITRQAAQQRWG